MLVLKYLQLKSNFSWSLSTLAALLRQQLFFYRDLREQPRHVAGGDDQLGGAEVRVVEELGGEHPLLAQAVQQPQVGPGASREA